MQESESITIKWNDGQALARAAIAVPANALNDQGKMRLYCDAFNSGGKHMLRSLSQIALIDYEDSVLDPVFLDYGEPIEIIRENGSIQINDGLVIFDDGGGGARVITHRGANLRRLLKEANRYCTRFVRLDVR